MKIKVAIADDHLMVLKGLQYMLSGYKNIAVCSIYTNGTDLLKHVSQDMPDVLLLDIQMPGIQGDEIAGMIAGDHPSISILVLTNLSQSVYIHKMIGQGALGYLLKNTDADTLITAIETVYKGQQFIDPALREMLKEEAVNSRKKAEIPVLSRREQDILQYIADECTSQEIAEKLFIGTRTIESIRLNLLAKLNCKNTAGLVRKAIQLDLIKSSL